MSVIKWEPGSDLDTFFATGVIPRMPRLEWDLTVDVYEEGGNVVAKMNLPGVDADGLDISIDEDLLTISGSRKEEEETNGKDYYSKEIRRGSFSRTVDLPRAVDASRAEAEYRDGVLTVTMPAHAQAKEHAVQVKVKH